jgi:hypothetical protein
MSIGRIPFAIFTLISRACACPFRRGLAAVAAVLAVFLQISQAQAQSVGASPTTVSYGPVMLGFRTNKVIITITNTGTVPLTDLSFGITGPALQDFLLSGPICSSLQPHQVCTRLVRFRPTVVGARSAALSMKSAELAPQQLVQLSGEGLAPAPKLVISTDELDFPDQIINTPSAPMTVQLWNVGALSLDINTPSIAPMGEFSLAPPTDCGVSPLAPEISGLNPWSCEVSVVFTPHGPGERTATLTITSSDPDGPKQVKLRGETAQAIPQWNPVSLEFGPTLVGDPIFAMNQSVTITNAGSADLVVSNATIINGVPSTIDFTLPPPAPTSCTVQAGSGQACTIKVRFMPHGSGDRSATLRLTTSVGDINIHLHGIGDVFLPTAPPIGGTTDVLFCSVDQIVAGAAPTCSTGTPQRCAGAGELLVQAIAVTRAFGSNNPGAPFLFQPTVAAAVTSGAMGPAVLEIMALGLGPAGSHLVTLNGPGGVLGGTSVGTFSVPGDGQWRLTTVTIPQTAIRFPGVAPIGSAPTPARNVVGIFPDVGGSGACVAVAWARLRIKAMSPVIFIHGANSNGAFFARQAIAGGMTLGGPAGSPILTPTPGSFQAAGIPTDTSINLPGTASVATNAAILQTLIPGIVRSFGVSNVHIVAHDKGGLDAREWLSANFSANEALAVAPFRVISFTTLSTPFRGTAAADLLSALQATTVQGLPVAALAELGFGVFNAAAIDMTTFAAPVLELGAPLPPGVDYRSVGGDADRNSNLLIQSVPPFPDEYAAERSEQPSLAGMFAINPLAADAVVTSVYQFMFTTRTVIVVPAFLPIPVPPFFLIITVPAPVPGALSPNDLLVTTASAFGSAAFLSLPAFAGATGVDHASVAGPRVGAAIIPLLRASDTTRGGLR